MKYNNTKINIGGTTYNVEFVDHIDTDDDDTVVNGLCDSSNNLITIATKLDDGRDMDDYDIEKNLWHEVIHGILNEGQYMEESDNEQLVEWLARCIWVVAHPNASKLKNQK